MTRPCSVCDVITDQGVLQCGHVFCGGCFTRYIHGSLEELLHYLRCSICGRMTVLTTESKTEVVERRFGRDLDPKLYKPIGMCQRLDGSYVTADPHNNRIYVFSRLGKLKIDFALVHRFSMMHGIVVNLCDEIVIPCKSGPQSLLAYFTPKGAYLGCAYLPNDAEVQGLAVSGKNEILAADSNSHCIHIVHEKRRLLKSVQIPSAPGEKMAVQPQGIVINHDGNVVVTDVANHGVKIFTEAGEMVRHFGSMGARPGQFQQPMSVCMDSRGRLLVADCGNHRVQLFDKDGNFLHFIVRYKEGDDVYMSPVCVLPLPNNMSAVMLRGDREAAAAEIRIYSCVQVK